jgi:drug/metabolite transporter (DMT)-like permease
MPAARLARRQLVNATPWPALAVALSACAWGLWWAPLRALAERGLPGPLASALIYLCAAALLLPLARRPAHRDRYALAGSALLGASYATWNGALLSGEVVRAVVLFYLSPLWTTALVAARERTLPGRPRLAALALGLGGALVLLGADAGVPLPRTRGDWLGLAAGMLFAAALVAIRLSAASTHGLTDTARGFAAAALCSLPLVWVLPGPHAPTADGPALLAVLGLAALIAAAWVVPQTALLYWGSRRLEPGRVSLLMLLELVVAAGSAAALAGEALGAREWVGCAAVLAAGIVDAAALRRRGLFNPSRKS